MTKLVFFGDPDSTKDAEDIYTAIDAEENVDLYINGGDNGYDEEFDAAKAIIDKHFPPGSEKRKRLKILIGNHDHEESEGSKAEAFFGAMFPELYKTQPGATEGDDSWEDPKWLWSEHFNNELAFIGMNSQDEDIGFKRNQYNWVVNQELKKFKELRTQGKCRWILAGVHKPWVTKKSSHSAYTNVREVYGDDFFNVVNAMFYGHNHNSHIFRSWKAIKKEGNAAIEIVETLLADGKTIDHSKEHGMTGNIAGQSGHEHNKFKENMQVPEIMWSNDSVFDYVVIETNNFLLNIKYKDKDRKVLFEYNISDTTPYGDNPPPPPPPIDCDESNMCIDPSTNECRPMRENELKDPDTQKCVINLPPPPPPGKCFEPNECFDTNIQRCRPIGFNETKDELTGECKLTTPGEPDIKDPICEDGYELKVIDGKCKCVKKGTTTDPHGCKENEYWNEELKKCIPKLFPDDTTNPPPPPENKPPVVDVGENKTVKQKEQITLNGAKSFDPNGDPLTFAWTQTKGEPKLEINNANTPVANFWSPDVPDGQEKIDYEFNLKVTDSKGASANKTLAITVLNEDTTQPPPPPMGNLIYSTFMHLVTGQDFTVNDTYGNQEPDGKGIYTAASGDPFVEVKADGTVWLCCKAGGHPRFYIKVNNYNYKESGWKMFPNKDPDDFNTKGRNRHNMGGDCDNRQGGIGFVHQLPNKVDSSCEICHNTRMGSVEGDTSKNYEFGKWYYFENYLCDVEGGQTRRIAKIDMNGRDTLPKRDETSTNLETVFDDIIKLPPSFYKKEMFDKESEAWHRMNPAKGTKAALFDYKIWKIEAKDLPPKA